MEYYLVKIFDDVIQNLNKLNEFNDYRIVLAIIRISLWAKKNDQNVLVEYDESDAEEI